jgi:virulence-associated protein VagC
MGAHSSGTAKVFMSGRSQAVRLPKEFRFDVDEVSIKRDGDSVILTPKRNAAKSWAEIREMAKAIPAGEFDAFEQALWEARHSNVPDVPRNFLNEVDAREKGPQ